MVSIRDYNGKIYLCSSCGQPCYEGPAEGIVMAQHFNEQWDGIHCPMFPLAAGLITVEWDDWSLEDLKQKYPDTYPHDTPRSVRPSAQVYPDQVEDEVCVDPGNFDGGYGEGSYYAHAMSKDD